MREQEERQLLSLQKQPSGSELDEMVNPLDALDQEKLLRYVLFILLHLHH